MQRTVTSTKIQRLFQYGDRPWNTGVIAAALLVPALMLAIGWMLWRDSTTARATYGMKFLVPTLDASWNPVAEEFQAWPFIYGTLLTSMTALLLSLPVSLGVAVFLAELCPNWLYQPLSWMIELLAAIPSVIYGLWGIFVFLPIVVTPIGNTLDIAFGNIPGIGHFFAGPMPVSGSSRLAASLILAIMITPTIAAVSRDVFLAIPSTQREASLA
ncbi:MAG: phosphate ABC transporter permease subunit PstC, partial [Anaerolineaceae bacterium]